MKLSGVQYANGEVVSVNIKTSDGWAKFIPEITAHREIVEYNDGSVDVECSNCGWDIPISGTRYCAYCGARLED